MPRSPNEPIVPSSWQGALWQSPSVDPICHRPGALAWVLACTLSVGFTQAHAQAPALPSLPFPCARELWSDGADQLFAAGRLAPELVALRRDGAVVSPENSVRLILLDRYLQGYGQGDEVNIVANMSTPDGHHGGSVIQYWHGDWHRVPVQFGVQDPYELTPGPAGSVWLREVNDKGRLSLRELRAGEEHRCALPGIAATGPLVFLRDGRRFLIAVTNDASEFQWNVFELQPECGLRRVHFSVREGQFPPGVALDEDRFAGPLTGFWLDREHSELWLGTTLETVYALSLDAGRARAYHVPEALRAGETPRGARIAVGGAVIDGQPWVFADNSDDLFLFDGRRFGLFERQIGADSLAVDGPARRVYLGHAVGEHCTDVRTFTLPERAPEGPPESAPLVDAETTWLRNRRGYSHLRLAMGPGWTFQGPGTNASPYLFVDLALGGGIIWELRHSARLHDTALSELALRLEPELGGTVESLNGLTRGYLTLGMSFGISNRTWWSAMFSSAFLLDLTTIGLHPGLRTGVRLDFLAGVAGLEGSYQLVERAGSAAHDARIGVYLDPLHLITTLIFRERFLPN